MIWQAASLGIEFFGILNLKENPPQKKIIQNSILNRFN
jgi:hypothetical protein